MNAEAATKEEPAPGLLLSPEIDEPASGPLLSPEIDEPASGPLLSPEIDEPQEEAPAEATKAAKAVKGSKKTPK
jgi:hypothetical protein